MTDGVEVRRIRHEDVAGFHDCLDAVARERRYLAQVEAPPPESVRRFVVENIEKGLPQFVARDAGQVVGWCDVLPRPHPGMMHCGALGMGLLPAYRGRGVGRRLLEATLADARAQGIVRVELEVMETNSAAIRLYQRAGFQHEGRKRRARILDGRAEDILGMALLLEG